MECEHDTHEVIDDDFWKLVQARADVRVWVAYVDDPEEAIHNCKKQIRLFRGTQKHDEYIFLLVYYKAATALHKLCRVRAAEC